MADSSNTGSSNQPLWAVSALAVLLAIGSGGLAMSQGSQVTELKGEVENLQIAVKKIQQAKAQPVPRMGSNAAKAGKGKAKAGGGGDVRARIDAFAQKNNIDEATQTEVKAIVDASMKELRAIGQENKLKKLPADQLQSKMMGVLKQRNDKLTALLGEEVAAKAIKLLGKMTSNAGGGGQAKAKSPRPGSRLPQ